MPDNTNETRAFNRGIREGRDEMKNAILKNIKEDISWIGDVRSTELNAYIIKKYSALSE